MPRSYRPRCGHNLVQANEYASAKIDCEREVGELLVQTPMNQGGRGIKWSPEATGLTELGINKNQSSRWQLFAKHADLVEAAKEAVRTPPAARCSYDDPPLHLDDL